MRPARSWRAQDTRRWDRFVDRLLFNSFATVTLLVCFGVVGTVVFAFPATDEVTSSDAVLVLGPPTVQRLITAQALVDDGVAPEIVISVPEGVRDDDTHPRLRDLCRGDTDYRVECLTPSPFTTQGEARLARQLMADRKWASVIVVTSVTHVARARLLFDRCIQPEAGRTEFTTDGRHYSLARWMSEFIYQAGAFVKAAVRPGC